MDVSRVCAVLLLIVGSVMSAKILVLLPMPCYSHIMPFMPIFKELGKRGHELTMITPFPEDPPPKGFKQITIDFNMTTFHQFMKKKLGWTPTIRNVRGRLFELAGMLPMCVHAGPLLLGKIKDLLPPWGTKYDLIIMEPFFCTETLLATSHLYKAPVVATLPVPLTPHVAGPLGSPLSFSYAPSTRIPSSDKMTLIERAWNTVVNIVELIGIYAYHIPQMDKLVREQLGVKDLPYLGELYRNISLVLAETHFAMNYQRAYHRNVLEVGGISFDNYKPLEKDLEKFMNDGKNGVILFSWGSHFQVDGEDELVQIFMKTFARLKQKVIFKWSNTDIPNTPDNVLIKKWVPQPAVLG